MTLHMLFKLVKLFRTTDFAIYPMAINHSYIFLRYFFLVFPHFEEWKARSVSDRILIALFVFLQFFLHLRNSRSKADSSSNIFFTIVKLHINYTSSNKNVTLEKSTL